MWFRGCGQWSEEGGEWFADIKEIVGSILTVVGCEVCDAHRVVHGFGDIGGCQRAILRVLSVAIAAAPDLPAANTATGQQVGEAVGPVIASGTGGPTGARITDAGFAAHFAGDQQQCLVEQTAFVQVGNQC